jgi:transketolase
MAVKAVRQAYGEALLELGQANPEVVVLDDDLFQANFVHLFKDAFPDRFFEIGIAEQNLVGVAAGLSDMGKIPFATAFATFLTKRAAEPLSVCVAYSGMNVKLVGHQAGLTAGPNGPTHMAIEDIAYTRAQPGLVVVEPADAVEMHRMVFAIAEYEGPVYMRVGRDDRPILFGDDHQITLGKAVQLRDGTDLAIIAGGIEVGMALEAAETLAGEGIQARVLNMHTIKPLDVEAILRAARETRAIVTAENHNIYGGLGSAVAEVLVENEPVPMRRIGLRDRFAESGPIPGLFEKYGMVARDIAQAARDVLKVKGKG